MHTNPSKTRNKAGKSGGCSKPIINGRSTSPWKSRYLKCKLRTKPYPLAITCKAEVICLLLCSERYSKHGEVPKQGYAPRKKEAGELSVITIASTKLYFFWAGVV